MQTPGGRLFLRIVLSFTKPPETHYEKKGLGVLFFCNDRVLNFV